MFRARDISSGNDVVALDVGWGDAIDGLREQCRSGEVVCPGCQQPVGLHAGRVLRKHFAHKSLSDCPFGRESYERLSARAMLYELLKVRFGDRVTVEEPISSDVPGEVADCVVTLSSGKAAYFIIPKQVRGDRESYIQLRKSAYEHVHWVLLRNLLKKSRDKDFLISAAVRDFADLSGISRLYPVKRKHELGSLVYFYANHKTMVFMRGMHLLHAPSVYRMEKGFKIPYMETYVDLETGQLMHPDEREPYEDMLESERKEQLLLEVQKEQKRLRLKELAEKEVARRKEYRAHEARIVEARKQRMKRLKEESEARCIQNEKIVREREQQTVVDSKWEPKPGQVADEDPSGKEFFCHFCGCMTRYWVDFRCLADAAGEECICNCCYAIGKRFGENPAAITAMQVGGR